MCRTLPSRTASFLRTARFSCSQFVKRDALLEIERECQLRWERARVFDADAPQVGIYSSVCWLHVCNTLFSVHVTHTGGRNGTGVQVNES